MLVVVAVLGLQAYLWYQWYIMAEDSTNIPAEHFLKTRAARVQLAIKEALIMPVRIKDVICESILAATSTHHQPLMAAAGAVTNEITNLGVQATGLGNLGTLQAVSSLAYSLWDRHFRNRQESMHSYSLLDSCANGGGGFWHISC